MAFGPLVTTICRQRMKTGLAASVARPYQVDRVAGSVTVVV